MPALLSAARTLLDIALLRRGPQDLPCSNTLLAILVGASALSSLAAQGQSRLPLITLMVILVYTAAFVHGVLQMKQLGARFTQTASAVFGTDALLTLVALPVLGAMPPGDAQPPPLAVVAYLALLIWNVAVLGHILRHALDTRMGVGVLWAVAYFIGTVLIAGFTGGPAA